MKRIILILLILVVYQSFGQITLSTYSSKGATVPFINATTYKHNGSIIYFLKDSLNGETNDVGTTRIGTLSGYREQSNAMHYNSFFGYNSGYSLTTGKNNIFIGKESGYFQTTQDNNIFIGQEAGENMTKSNRFILSNIAGTNENGDTTKALMHGFFNSDYTKQRLTVNGKFFFNGIPYKNTTAVADSQLVTRKYVLNHGGSSQWINQGNKIYYDLGSVNMNDSAQVDNYLDVEGKYFQSLVNPSDDFTIKEDNRADTVLTINLAKGVRFDPHGLGYKVGIGKTAVKTFDVNGSINGTSYYLNDISLTPKLYYQKNIDTLDALTYSNAYQKMVVQDTVTKKLYRRTFKLASGLSTTGTGFLKGNGTSLSFDNSTYLTANQSISLGGILSGSGTTSITASAASGYYMPSSTDKSTWDAKQAALTNPVTGIGTSGQVPLLNGASTISGASNIYSDGTYVGVGTAASSSYILNIGSGEVRLAGPLSGASTISSSGQIASAIASLTTTLSNGFLANSASAALVGTQERRSPSFAFDAKVWNTTSSVSKTNRMAIGVRGYPGTTTSASFDLENVTIDGTSNSNLIARFTSGGALNINGTLNFGADGGSSDAYAVTISGITAYATGMMITFTTNTANTGACSVNVNALGAKSLKMKHDQDPSDNYFEVGSVCMAVYDGTNFQIISPAAN